MTEVYKIRTPLFFKSPYVYLSLLATPFRGGGSRGGVVGIKIE